MTKTEMFARMKPRKCDICGKYCKNYQGEVVHKRQHNKVAGSNTKSSKGSKTADMGLSGMVHHLEKIIGKVLKRHDDV